jgi:hypothetical protein
VYITGAALDRPGLGCFMHDREIVVQFRQGNEIFILSMSSRLALGSTRTSVLGHNGLSMKLAAELHFVPALRIS